MSFLKITDPAKRDYLVQELIKTRRNTMQGLIDEIVGEITAQQSLSKLFKPLTEKIETTTKAIKEMPQQPVYPAIQAAPPLAQASIASAPLITPAGSELASQQAAVSTTELGEIATAYFKRFTKMGQRCRYQVRNTWQRRKVLYRRHRN
jgi:hypothetical protein